MSYPLITNLFPTSLLQGIFASGTEGFLNQPQIALHKVQPSVGLLTWCAEGSGDPLSPYFSRFPHVPGLASGVTIGRGYDMKLRSREEILSDLQSAGVSRSTALALSLGAQLSGQKARAFAQSYQDAPLGAEQERVLFETTWQRMYDDVQRISERAATVSAYGRIPWTSLDPRITDILVDLRYRGDYTPRSREFIQGFAASNDLARVTAAMCDRDLWPGVPSERFHARCRFLTAH